MGGLVSFPMYMPPPEALAQFWAGLRHHMVAAGLDDVPEALTETEDRPALWLDPGLLLAQTCGYPFTTLLAGRVRYVGTPCYAAEGCEGPHYTSLVVVRADDPARSIEDLRGRRAAYNERGSQSGYNAFRALIAPHARSGQFFASTIETGAHRRSMAAVAGGTADCAAVDCVTFALCRAREPEAAAALRVLARTPPGVPGLPFITALRRTDAEVAALRAALAAAMFDESLVAARKTLLFAGFEVLPERAYQACLAMERSAIERGYPDLA